MKKAIVLLLAVFFTASVVGCGTFNRGNKNDNPGKKKGHYKYEQMM